MLQHLQYKASVCEIPCHLGSLDRLNSEIRIWFLTPEVWRLSLKELSRGQVYDALRCRRLISEQSFMVQALEPLLALRSSSLAHPGHLDQLWIWTVRCLQERPNVRNVAIDLGWIVCGVKRNLGQMKRHRKLPLDAWGGLPCVTCK